MVLAFAFLSFLNFQENKLMYLRVKCSIFYYFYFLQKVYLVIKVLWKVDKPPEEGGVFHVVYLYFSDLICTGMK